jgi:hypothetical protein
VAVRLGRRKTEWGEKMDRIENLFEGIVALIFLIIFGALVLPALQGATGQSMGLFYISLFMIGIGIVAGIIKLFSGGRHGGY